MGCTWDVPGHVAVPLTLILGTSQHAQLGQYRAIRGTVLSQAACSPAGAQLVGAIPARPRASFQPGPEPSDVSLSLPPHGPPP